MALCSRCSAFDIQTFTPTTFPTRGYPLLSIIKSADEDNCSFCSMLLDQFRLIYGRNELPQLFYKFKNPDTEALSLLGRLLKRVSTTIRNAKDIAIPPWVHFSIKRVPSREPSTESGLNIIEITASILSLPDEQEWSGLWGAHLGHFDRLLHGISNGSWNTSWKKIIHLHVAADSGTAADESGDIKGTLTLDQHTWSEAHYENIKAWHRDCCRTHNCNITTSGYETVDAEDAPLPTRCVEFKFLDKHNIWTSSIGWVLRETEHQRGKYIALSHRWTQSTEEAKTTKDNYQYRVDRWSQEQDEHLRARGSLSTLFLDAGRLACHLGIRYVWIDSICIVQDDNADWEREALKMATYYQHSWLTIGVAAISDSEGLFRTPDTAMIPRVTRLPYRDKSGQQNGHFYVQAVSSQQYTNEYETYVVNSELLSRGWVYQEWKLSRRILVVSEVRLFLQCQRPLPISLERYSISSRGLRNADFRYTPGKNVLSKDNSVKQILDSWEQVVTTFSGLHITNFEDDRLVALSGIAAEYGSAFYHKAASCGDLKENQFICGLWTEWSRGLQWEQAEPTTQARVKGFPTWSWLSISSEPEADAVHGTQKAPSGLRVQWAPLESRAVKETYISLFDKPIFVPLTANRQPLFEHAGSHEGGNPYGNDKRFAIWPIRGRIIQVLVGSNFDSEGDAAAAGVLTAHKLKCKRCMWRKVSLASSPNLVVGWASLEHPAHQLDQTSPPPKVFSALVISKLCRVQIGPNSFEGHLSGFHEVFKVLFLVHRDILRSDNYYERVGIGRLFGSTVDAEVQATTVGEVNLV